MKDKNSKIISTTLPSGKEFEGRMEGVGKYRFYDKSRSKYIAKYEGEFKDSSINGVGNMEYSDGCVYNGHWRNGHRDGEGQLYFPSGRILSGFWKDDNLVEGTCVNPDGSHYIGGLSDKCLYAGFGTHFYSDGLWAQGYWKDGELIEGKIFNPNGNVYLVINKEVVSAQKWRSE